VCLCRLGGLGAEAVDELLHAGDLTLLLGRLLREPAFVLRPGVEVLRVGAPVLDDVATRRLGRAVEVQHPRDRLVEQVEIVADHQQRTPVLTEEPHQPGLRVDVEVVGRLVETEHVAAGEEDPRQFDATPLTTGQHTDR